MAEESKMRGFRIFEKVFTLFVVVAVAGASLSLHRYFVHIAVQEAVKRAQEALVERLKFQLGRVYNEQRADRFSDRSDVDRIIRGIARMRRLVMIRNEVDGWGVSDYLLQYLHNEADRLVATEVKYLAPYVYRYGDRQMFLTFGDNLHYVGLTAASAGLEPDYWVALAKAK